MTTGEKIKQYRKRNGITQEKLAELVDVSLTSIRRWEWGENVPNLKYIQKLAEVLNITPDDLLPDKVSDVEIKVMSEQKAVKKDGMATVELGNGKTFSAPATPEGYAFLKELFLASLNAPTTAGAMA